MQIPTNGKCTMSMVWGITRWSVDAAMRGVACGEGESLFRNNIVEWSEGVCEPGDLEDPAVAMQLVGSGWWIEGGRTSLRVHPY